MERIKLNFSDFWPNFNKTDNYFYNSLVTRYDVIISDSPDFLIYSRFGKEFLRYKCIRVFYTGENRRPNFDECDYAFSSDYINSPDHYRLPLYALYVDPRRLVKPEDYDVDGIIQEKKKFCSFVVSNPNNQIRNDFFIRLSKYKRVDSGGMLFNNIGGPVRDKGAFIRAYKFNIAFENSSYPGYTTEKIVESMLVNSLAIYWGNELIHLDFNPTSFLNYFDFDNVGALIDKIIQLDNDDDLYKGYLRQPYYHNNEVNEFVKPENVLKQFEYIFNNDRMPIAQKRRKRFMFFFNLPKLPLRQHNQGVDLKEGQIFQRGTAKSSDDRRDKGEAKIYLGPVIRGVLPLVSVVTPSYNQGRFIEETMLSVKSQTYPNIEHIVVDGGSTDETLDILRKYSDSIAWVSEPDEGQSDAINKGWRMSRGEILAYLNADDTYMPWVVQTAVEFLAEHPDVGMVYGDADFIDEHGEVTRHYQVGEFDLKRMLCSYNHVPQPTVFFRREVLDAVGYLDENLHLAMDLDYWIRISLKFRIDHIAQTLATMRFYPEAKIPSQYYKAVYEHLRILDKFYANHELSKDIKAFKRRAYSAVHLRGSIDYHSAGQIGKARKHLMKALIWHPQYLKDFETLNHLARLLLGEKATRTIARSRRKLIDKYSF